MGDSDYSLQKTLEIPSSVACLAFGRENQVLAGSDDGTLRVYDPSSFKVLKGFRGLGEEVSSVVCSKRTGHIWVACGRQAFSFDVDSPNMIVTASDAISKVQLCEADDDVVNELCLDANESNLAFSTDSGVVGTVSFSNMEVSRMKTKHQSVCVSVKFIPDRPRELVSSGYDHALLHFDFVQGNLLSRRDIPPIPSSDATTLSPPFVMCTAVSSTGLIAAGVADGRLFVGAGGEKRPSVGSGKKKSKKWNGLNEAAEVLNKVAEGPIVAMQFSDSQTLTVSTLLGNIIQFRCDHIEERVQLTECWRGKTKTIEKVNALIIDSKRIILGGLTHNGKGVLEFWESRASSRSPETSI